MIQSYLDIFSNCSILHRAEIEMYKELEPATRLVILKAICDIRVEVRSHFYYHLMTYGDNEVGKIRHFNLF